MEFMRVTFDGSNGDQIDPNTYTLEEAISICTNPEEGGAWDTEQEAREALTESYQDGSECPIDVGQDQHDRFLPRR